LKRLKLPLLCVAAYIACTQATDTSLAAYRQLDIVLQRIAEHGILPLTIATISDTFPPEERKRLRLVPQEVEGATVSDLSWTDPSDSYYAYFSRTSRQTEEVAHFWMRCTTPNRKLAASVLVRWIGILDSQLQKRIADRIAASQLDFYEEEPRALGRGRISLVVAIRSDQRAWHAQLEVRLGDFPAAMTMARRYHAARTTPRIVRGCQAVIGTFRNVVASAAQQSQRSRH
jgi:hypothetical protein